MSTKCDIIPRDLEVNPLGENGEMEILPASDHLLTSRLPCGLPPILPDTTSVLNSFLEDIDKLPLFDLDVTQRYMPGKPNIHSLFQPKLCPLKTELVVKRDLTTGKLLGFVEQEKDLTAGTTTTSTSLSRAPGRPDVSVKGSTSSFPFWPGGMDEPWANLIVQEPLNTSLFHSEYLKVPPGFKEGMEFERMYPQKALFMNKISLTDIFAMEDLTDFSPHQGVVVDDDVNIEQVELKGDPDANKGVSQDLVRIEDLPVLKISDVETKHDFSHTSYKWAVIEDVKQPIMDFEKRIPDIAFKWDFELDTFQKKAVLHLEKNENVFVSAHTSAGKTVVAEYAIALAKKHMTRVIYTSPIKALSNQKFREFKDAFEDVGLITGDVQINEKAFCLIMTTEILRSMLYHGSDILREVEWVIFDEVHYINDAERGVVWEEVFIMLPKHVNLIMLSATVPNTAEFAEWLGGIKKRKIYVIQTLKRPTPLTHYLFTGCVGISQDDCFLIVDAGGNFLVEKYTKALNSKQDREAAIKKDREAKGIKKDVKGRKDEPRGKMAFGAKSSHYNVSMKQEENIYIGLLGYLKKHNLLPVICFTLSRKRCNEHAQMLRSQDLTTTREKREIMDQFCHSIAKLKDEDKELSQVLLMKEHLLRGFGVHHSGILPILKEVVEMLFQKGLVKVLFATETFAMGVNMPARTVVFDSIRKHDGLEFRTLQASEYIQMAGRAGRRGKDMTGTVIILCKGEVPAAEILRKMMLGKATQLQSQFKLTYSMILNLLKVKTLRVEEVMKRSFGESSRQKEQDQNEITLAECQKKLSELTKPECSLCSIDMDFYCRTLSDLRIMQETVMQKVNSVAIGTRALAVGKIVTFMHDQYQSTPGLVLNISKEDKLKILIAKSNLSADIEPVPWSNAIQLPDESEPAVLIVPSSSILLISSKPLKIDADLILREWQRMSGMKTRPGDNITSAFQEFINFCRANKKGFPLTKLNFQDFTLVTEFSEFKKLQDALENQTCIKCPQFSKHFSIWSSIIKLELEIEELKYKMSEKSLQFHPEYNKRKEVLELLGYIDSNDMVQLKGSVAREMSNHELLITELLVKCVFNNCTPEEIAAILSCMVFQHKKNIPLEHLGITNNLIEKIKAVQTVIDEIDKEQRNVKIEDPNFVNQYNFHLTPVVYEWAKGVSFANIMKNVNVDVEEGIIVRCIQRLCELLKDLKSAASLVGDTVLAKKMSDASALIKRDIVFAASLYIQ